ncbi:hypothetical protein CHS0354_020969 [Potamilus streckersoni]|uniref:Kinesin-like protein n=1 Tax=Potamilus streckersoni TaxID=2493646 RepID=A0AAE0SYL3_9BIVA|nr:hypothetical protein CHS0354_020969 [Potamilus streckersoni]
MMASEFHTPSTYDMLSKKHSPVFKTPMTYSPRIVGNKPVPSPSRQDLWKKELGLNDDLEPQTDSDENSEEDEAEEDVNRHISQVEVISLQKQLEQRNSQRDELLLLVKSHRDKVRQYKSKLEREENNKRQQLKILKKNYDITIQEKDNLISNLQSLAEEQENKILELEQRLLGGNHEEMKTTGLELTSGATRKLIEEVKRLQNDKFTLTSQLSSAQTEVRTCNEIIQSLQVKISKLENDNDNLSKPDKVQEDEVTYPCSTDTEKEVELLQTERQQLLEELVELKKARTKEATVYKLASHRQQQLEDEVKRLKQKLDDQEKEAVEREAAIQQKKEKEQQVIVLLSEKQQNLHTICELQAQITALQAKEPEVITKVKKVEVQVESEELKTKYAVSQEQIQELTKINDEVNNKLSHAHARVLELETQLQVAQADFELMTSSLQEKLNQSHAEKEIAIAEASKKLQQEVDRLRADHSTFCQKLDTTNNSFSQLIESFILLQKKANSFPHMIKSTVSQVKIEVCSAIADIDTYNQELVGKYHREMQLRKKYHNELVELKGNIRVFCRVRPKIKEDGTGSQADNVISFDRDDDGLIYVESKGRSQTFEVDRVFSENSTQTEVFDEVKSVAISCIDGFNVCIFAYGQTGSGKTYTMEGTLLDPGINQRALQELFHVIEERGLDWEYTVTVSVLEIYNEMIRDLLGDDISFKMEVKMNPEGGLYIPGLSYVNVASVEDVNKVFVVGQKNRATATTNMNEHSSRSHALLCVTVTGENKTTKTRTTGKLNLVDLAGSERVSKSGADGARLKEAQSINKSLACLGDVIQALRAKQSYIPYRNSKLTYLLQDSLGGDSKTLMLVQIAPVRKNEGETICSLNFAQRVRNVELGAATRKVEKLENGDVEVDKTPQKSSSGPGTPHKVAPQRDTSCPAISHRIASQNLTKTPTSSSKPSTPQHKSTPGWKK